MLMKLVSGVFSFWLIFLKRELKAVTQDMNEVGTSLSSNLPDCGLYKVKSQWSPNKGRSTTVARTAFLKVGTIMTSQKWFRRHKNNYDVTKMILRREIMIGKAIHN